MVSSDRRRNEVMEALRTALREYLGAVDAFDEGVAQELGISRTDLRCIDLLERRGTMTAGALADGCGLSSGAMTFLLDRMERAGMVRRVRDPADRRRVLVELVAAAGRRAWEVHRPMVEEMRALAARYGVDELAMVCRFLTDAKAVYEKHAPTRRPRPAPPGSG